MLMNVDQLAENDLESGGVCDTARSRERSIEYSIRLLFRYFPFVE